MNIAKWMLAIIVAVVVPFALGTGWIIALNHPTVQAILRPLGLIGDLAGLMVHVAIVALGSSFIVRRAGWQDLELPERQLLIGSGIIYFR